MNDLSSFGLRLAAARKGKNLNQADFATLAGTNKNSQGDYEKGKTAPTVEYLYRLAEHGIDIGYVLTGTRAEQDHSNETSRFINRLMMLSDRERRAVMGLVEALLAPTPQFGSIAAMADPDQLALAQGALQAPQQPFRGKQ